MNYSQKRKSKVKCRICGMETNDYTLLKVPGTNKAAWVCKWHVGRVDK